MKKIIYYFSFLFAISFFCNIDCLKIIHITVATEINSAISDLRKEGDRFFSQGHYQEALIVYKQVLALPEANLNDMRNYTDTCGRIFNSSEPSDANRESYLQKWASAAEQAAMHPEAGIQDFRNVAGVYYSLKDYSKATEWRCQAANHAEATEKDLEHAMLIYRIAGQKDQAQFWERKLQDKQN